VLLRLQGGGTALHGAAAAGHEGVVRALLEAGADKNARTSVRCATRCGALLTSIVC
jgi:ankyrin repeat protein